MNTAGAITLGISITTFFLGIIYKLTELSVRFGRMQRTLEANDARDEEERRKNSSRFTELFNSRNAHETTLARLDTNMTNIDVKLEKIDAKLDRIISEGKK